MTGLEGLLGTPEQLAAAAAITGGLIVVGGVIAWVVKYVWPLSHRLGRFLDDWQGVEARPGFDAVPGFPQRLKAVETTTHASSEKLASMEEAAKVTATTTQDTATKLDRLEAAVADIQHNVKPNSGSSAHDAITGPLKDISDFLTTHFPDWKPTS